MGRLVTCNASDSLICRSTLFPNLPVSQERPHADYVKVARVEDIPPGAKKIVEVDGVEVVVVNLDGVLTPWKMCAHTTAARWAKARWTAAS